MKKLRTILASALLFLAFSAQTPPLDPPTPAPSASPSPVAEATPVVIDRKLSYDYPAMFAYAREHLTKPSVRRFLKEVFAKELEVSLDVQTRFGFPEKIKDFSESQFVLLLQHNPDLWKEIDDFLTGIPNDAPTDPKEIEEQKAWTEKFRMFISDAEVLKRFQRYNDPSEPVSLRTADGSPGYRNLEVFVNHETVDDTKRVTPASNLKALYIDFIKNATRDVWYGFLEADLKDFAAAQIEAGTRGVKVVGGMDSKTADKKPDAAAYVQELARHENITFYKVDSVGLFHMKVMARDTSDPDKATVILSSANATQSCVGPEGDLVAYNPRPKDSIPNANHAIQMNSQILAQLVKHSLLKTYEMGLRGAQFPLSGTFRIYGEGTSKAQDPDVDPYMAISFTPNGGVGDPGRDLISRSLLSTRGPVYFLQFAMSSPGIEDALYERAKREIKRTGKFEFYSVGDGGFAIREWSVFLSMSGYTVDANGDIQVDQKSRWRKLMNKADFAQFQSQIRIAPPEYRMHRFKAPDGSVVEYQAKHHHKAYLSGDAVGMGTSYNSSEAAKKNNEQLVVFVREKKVSTAFENMFRPLYARSTYSVAGLIERVRAAKALKNAKSGTPDDLKSILGPDGLPDELLGKIEVKDEDCNLNLLDLESYLREKLELKVE